MRISVARRFGPIIFSFVITSVCLFGSSGRLDWPNAWVLLGLNSCDIQGTLACPRFSLATPLILDSWWAFAPAAVTAAMFVLRTVLEDRTLHNELDDYVDYTRRVKYKLLPAIW